MRLGVLSWVSVMLRCRRRRRSDRRTFPALLNAARALAPGAHFYAKVLAENAASLALFRGCGYALGPDGYYHSGGEV